MKTQGQVTLLHCMQQNKWQQGLHRSIGTFFSYGVLM